MTKHDEPATLEQDGYASTRGLWDVVTGEDPIKPIITACLSGDDATLKSLLAQKQYAEAMLMKQLTIYDIREDQESSRDAQRVQSSEQSNLSRAMILAARENHASIVSTLLAFAAEHDVPYEDAVSRIFVIYRTMRDDKPDVMRAIAKAWPEVTKVDINHGVLPLYHAVKHGQVEMVDVLLKAGADPKLTYGSPPSFSPDPLVYAGVYKYPWVAQLLLQYGFPPENTCALHRAAAKGNLDTIRALAQGGVDVDGQWADDDNKTPLHAAAEHGQEEAMALLNSLGATDNKRDSQGRLAQQLLDEYKTGQ